MDNPSIGNQVAININMLQHYFYQINMEIYGNSKICIYVINDQL